MKLRFELNENQLNNLMTFLDRVNFKGLAEAQAMSELLIVFSNPIKDETVVNVNSE